MADVHSIGGYTFAAGLFFLGLNGWWVLAGLVIATFAILGLMNLTGSAGQRLGVPFPVLARLSFGVLGANIPALIRAIVGVACYGIQTYLAPAVWIAMLILAIWVAVAAGGNLSFAFSEKAPVHRRSGGGVLRRDQPDNHLLLGVAAELL